MSTPTGTGRIYKDHQVLHVRDQADQASFFELVKDDTVLAKFQQHVRKLVIHLNARQLMLSKQDNLVLALNRLHPTRNGANITNPHNLETICFVVDSDILFTRFNYALTSPTPYTDEDGRLADLLRNTLTPAKKKEIAFQVTSTVGPITPALLGLRCIKNVVFETFPRPCKLEGGFREMLELTLPCAAALVENIPPPSRDSLRPYATADFDKEGNFRSDAYDADTSINPYEEGEQFDTNHIDGNDGFTLYNMVAINPQKDDQIYDASAFGFDSMPTDLQSIQLGWKI
ncbi:uncharacterized protein N0V89_010915 [Didymosphaeria variabile]|uniref:Uncharacterized protein n=1 Tax=Didymosphaeria variabile TaxID=1932322 RepID=A0A9W8XE90_9PLEO|nr:uncharacterized protein N0V89_010915 [Didymosphaeria variabile]KAJ4346981.1 hypothetical protein N0V89_010915 [Didymosphaeria variabile]